MVRFTADGQLDSSFGVNGYVTFATPPVDLIRGLEVDGSGRILLVTSHGLRVMNTSGGPDPAFANLANFSGAAAVIVHADGSLTMVVTSLDYTFLDRYDSSGSLLSHVQSDFRLYGRVHADDVSNRGSGRRSCPTANRVSRGANQSGLPDTPFGPGPPNYPDGFVPIAKVSTLLNVADITDDGSDGYFVLGDVADGLGYGHPAILRLNSSGQVDSSFGTDGVLALNPAADVGGQVIARTQLGLMIAGGVGARLTSMVVPIAPTTPSDTTPPSATITNPVDGATYPLLTSEAAAYTCSDNVAVASCVGSVPVGSPLPANTPGSTPFTVSATDTSGLNATATSTYTVSNTLADGLGLTGSFTTIPTSVSVADAPAPDGVVVTVPIGGSAPAVMSICGGFIAELEPGTTATLTCGSVIASVTSGAVKVTTPGGTASMTVPAGGTASLTSAGVPTNLGTTPITFVGPMTRIAVSPAVAVVGTGVSQGFAVEGFDAYGQSLGDKTAAATFTITPSATCTANSCKATTVGVRTVMARIGSLSSTATLDVRKAQTIKFTAPTTKTMTQSPVTVSATATSGLTVSFISTTPAVCTTTGANGTTVLLVGAGTCGVTAQQAGDATWAPAPDLARTFTVNRATQTITFPTLTARTIDQSPITVAATSSSGLAVVFSTTTPAVCTTSGTNGASIILLDAGTCTVRADQAGDTVYGPANPVSRSFAVSKLANTITFVAPAKKTLAETPVVVAATSSSGLPVTFTSTTIAVCTSGGPDGSTITLVAAGTCTIRADQGGNGIYKAASPVNRSFTVARVAADHHVRDAAGQNTCPVTCDRHSHFVEWPSGPVQHDHATDLHGRRDQRQRDHVAGRRHVHGARRPAR